MNSRFYVTTPIYYVNDVPHIGHAYTTVAADILARRNRLLGKKVFFLTGTDEHGQKVEKAAAEKGRTPQEHADIMVANFRELWRKLDISNDAFIRTTDAEHIRTVQGLMQMLWDWEKIEKRSYAGWYCTPDERFWTEKELVDGNCPDCGRPVEQIREENYFFLMSKYQERLIKYIQDNPSYLLPETRRNEVLGFLKNNALGDLCISRPKQRLSWGISLPFDENFVTYVWFDALVNYFSATRYLAPGAEKATPPSPPLTKGGNEGGWWPASHHLVGKDILTTHAVYWSTILMALNLPLPENIFAHGWWMVEGRKMSKSLGNVVDPHTMVDKYGVDAFRYFLFREVPFGLDGDFSEAALIRRINTDLANDLGNLLSRTLTMIKKYRGGIIPGSIDSKDEWDWEGHIKDRLRGSGNDLEDRYASALKDLRFHNALDHIWDVISLLNRYVDKRALWKEEDEGKRSNTLYVLAEALGIIAVYLFPFMPVTAQRMWDQLGITDKMAEVRKIPKWGDIRIEDKKIERGEQLFPRIAIVKGVEITLKSAAIFEFVEGTKKMDEVPETKVKEAVKPTDNYISIEDFAKVELKIGRVVSAERVEKSDKLIKLKVDIGEERQIVAGIGKAYEPEYLMGKEVVVVANLKPAKLMGVESQGMLLAATDDGGKPSILILDREVKPGARVK